MLKILKSRVAKYAIPGNYTAKHTGKSGYVATTPRGGAPIPYSFFEELSSNLYPEVREYVPTNYRDYTDSYYDLRNKQYQEWYKKWGKPTIDKYMTWWKENYAEIQAQLQASLKKKNGKFRNTRSKYYGGFPSNYNSCRDCNRKSLNLRCRKCFLKYRSTRQRPYSKRRSSYRQAKYRYFY